MSIGVPVTRGQANLAQGLIAQAKRGDREAFAELFMEHFDGVYAYFRIAFNDADAAERATEDLFVRALSTIEDYGLDEEPFGDWLLATAHGAVARELGNRNGGPTDRPEQRRRRRRVRGASAEDELRALRWATDADLLLLLDRLPEAQRQALVLAYILDFSNAEVAGILSRTPARVSKLQGEALAFLTERLSALGREGGRGRLAMRRLGRRRGPAHGVTLLR